MQATEGTGSPPAFAGGTIADGTYFMTSSVVYGADAGIGVADFQGAFVVGAGTVQLVRVDNGGCRRASGTFTTSGNKMTVTETCGSFFQGQEDGGLQTRTFPYTATSTMFTIPANYGPGVIGFETYTKQ